LGSKSPRVEISQPRNKEDSNAILREQMPKIIDKKKKSSNYGQYTSSREKEDQDQAELDCHGVTEMVELD